MDRAIRAFLAALTVQQGASPQTIRAYASDLAQFQVFAQDASNRRRPVNPKSIEPALIRDFLAARDRMGERNLPWRGSWPVSAVYFVIWYVLAS